MRFIILSLFPEMFESFLSTSMIKKSIVNEFVQIVTINIRDYSDNKHHKTDDYPFGGGPGMVMTAQPIADAITHAKKELKNPKVVYFSPHGQVLSQEKVVEFSKEREFILLCGHYEGIDYRIIEKYVDYEISIGDYILTGGEIPAMVFIDSVSRYVEGVLGNQESTMNESFSTPLLEHPQYTRPQIYEGVEVPEVLLSGNHERIKKWRLEKSIEITKKNRPDLYEKYLDNE